MSFVGRIVGAVPDSLISSEDLESVAAARRASDAELVAKARTSTRRRPVVEEVNSSSSDEDVPQSRSTSSAREPTFVPPPPRAPPPAPLPVPQAPQAPQARSGSADSLVIDDATVAQIVAQLAQQVMPSRQASPPIPGSPRDIPGTPVPERVDPNVLGRSDGWMSASPSRKFYSVTKSVSHASISEVHIPTEAGPFGEKACSQCRGFHPGSPCPWESAARSASGPPDWYYGAVARGRIPGVYLSWGETEKQIMRFSGNLHEKFRTYEKVWEFVSAYREVAPIPPPPVETAPQVAPPPFPVVGALSRPVGNMQSGPSRGVCIGQDTSAGTESELFGIPIQSESQLQAALTPPNLSPDAQAAFTDQTPDGTRRIKPPL
eukprot:scaffold109612_cov51-Attheya_sp.AAC.3